MRIDESIHLQLREKYGDKMLRMQKGDPQVYEELFSYSCPKFLSPVVPNYDNVYLTPGWCSVYSRSYCKRAQHMNMRVAG